MQNNQIQFKDFYSFIQKGKAKHFTVLNTQTGNAFTFKVEWGTFNPDSLYGDEIPLLFSSYVGSGEHLFLGYLYGLKNYVHYNRATLDDDYPCVKILKYVIGFVASGKYPTHIEIYEGCINTEPEPIISKMNTSPYSAFEEEEKRLDAEYYGKNKKRNKVAKVPVSCIQMQQLQYGNINVELLSSNLKEEIADNFCNLQDRKTLITNLLKL